jgi:four helix bundle protein
MAKIENFENIEAWKSAREATKQIYLLSSAGEFSRDFGLRDQIRRSSVSIMSNIAEGFEREGNREFLNFLSIAKGSCGEARAQLYVALDQHYIQPDQFDKAYKLLSETGRLVGGFMRYLKSSDFKGNKFR